MKHRLALEAEAAGSVGHQAATLRDADLLAEVCFPAEAIIAFAAFRRVKRDHVIAGLERCDACPYLAHDAGTFMAKDRRKHAFGIIARQGELVGVADAGCLQFDQHLAGPGAFELHRFDREGFASLEGYGGADIHGRVPVWWCEQGRQSIIPRPALSRRGGGWLNTAMAIVRKQRATLTASGNHSSSRPDFMPLCKIWVPFWLLASIKCLFVDFSADYLKILWCLFRLMRLYLCSVWMIFIQA